MQTDCCSSCPGGWSQTILEVKMLDLEVLGWCGYTWSAVVRPVGCTAKFSETPLEMAYGREIHRQHLWWTFLQSSCQLHAPSKLATSMALCCVRQLEIISQYLNWDTNINSIVKKAQQNVYFLRQLRKFNLPQELLKQFYSAVVESVLCTSVTVWFGSATKSGIRRLQRTVRNAERIIGTPLPTLPITVFIQSEKRLRKSLWIPHIQVIPFFNFCHLAGATEPQLPGQSGTRTVSSPRQSNLWTVKCPPPPPPPIMQ